MPRPSRLILHAPSLMHNVRVIRASDPATGIVAMVKSDAYGCGIRSVIPELEGHVDKFGVATLEEALAIRALGARTPCVIFQGVFAPAEWEVVSAHGFEGVISQEAQLRWLLQTPLCRPVKVWIKVNTGMNRLGFSPEVLPAIIAQLRECAWVRPDWVVMTHFANADEGAHPLNQRQYDCFQRLVAIGSVETSLSNSAALLGRLVASETWKRPGLMLYGVSPFANQTGLSIGLRPVMRLEAAVIHVFEIEAGEAVGYGSTWIASRRTRVGVLAIGYGDGYPRHVKSGTPVWIRGQYAPIIGRVSMDTLTIDLTDLPDVTPYEWAELWGLSLPIEVIAAAAGTIPYELMTQIQRRRLV